MTAKSILSIVNPASGAKVAEVPIDDAGSVDKKATAARAAQRDWVATPLAERLAVVRRFRSAVVDQKEALAATLTQEVGKPITQSRNELAGLLPRLDFFIESAAGAFAEEEVHAEASMRERISREPLGVVGNISAWNYPWFVGCNVIVPALLAGNAVLYKPSEYATLTGLAIARLLRESGLPPALLPCVVGGGETGAAVIAQRIDGLFFTGSHATGVRIAQALAGRLVRLQLELGGKDPVYVRADADVASAAESLADGAMYNTGQSCCSVERIYVHERLHDTFVERFVATVRGMKRGDPMQSESYIGAITRAPQLQVLQSQVDEAVSLGAVLHCGGHILPGPGNWFDPAVLSQVDHRMALMREESFGPVIGIQRVSGDDEAVNLMNDTRYGLTAGVYTRDEAVARALLARVNAGSVYWNCCDRVSPRLPWSGVGDSGIGLTLSVEGLRAFTRPKAWHLRSPPANP